MNIKIYSDNINEHQRMHLIDAIHTVNGAQNHFFLSKDLREINLPGGRSRSRKYRKNCYSEISK